MKMSNKFVKILVDLSLFELEVCSVFVVKSMCKGLWHGNCYAGDFIDV